MHSQGEKKGPGNRSIGWERQGRQEIPLGPCNNTRTGTIQGQHSSTPSNSLTKATLQVPVPVPYEGNTEKINITKWKIKIAKTRYRYQSGICVFDLPWSKFNEKNKAWPKWNNREIVPDYLALQKMWIRNRNAQELSRTDATTTPGSAKSFFISGQSVQRLNWRTLKFWNGNNSQSRIIMIILFLRVEMSTVFLLLLGQRIRNSFFCEMFINSTEQI